MVKNKMARVVGAAMSAALAFSTCVPMITANANSVEQGQKNIEKMDKEEFEYASQEIQIALELLENSDLTNIDNYNRMMKFTDAAKQRLEGMESSEEVDKLYSEITDKIFPSADIALRLMNDMRELQNANKEDKEPWINALNEAITYARENNLLNYNTLKSAIDVLHKEAGLITDGKDNQLGYAEKEIEIALELLENADLTNVDNYDRMMAFTDAAKQRLEGMESSEEVDKLYSEITDKIFPSSKAALRLMKDMRELQNANKENKESWLYELNEAIVDARDNNLANNNTLKSARKVLYKEAELITDDTLLIDGIMLEQGIATDLKPLVLFVQHEKAINELINEMNSKCTYTLVDKPRIEGNNKIYKTKLISKKEVGTDNKLKIYSIELKVDLNNKSVIDKLDTLFKLGDTGSTSGGNKRPSSSIQTIKLKDTVGHWAEGIVNDFVNKGYINGYEDNTFKPNNAITRAEFVTFVNNYFGLTKSSSRVFNDTNGHWAERAIDIAVTNGICKGISNTEFKPNDPITREQASVMISNYKKLSDKNNDKLNKFTDNKDVSSWSKDSVEGMIEKGYMNGYSNNTFKPKSHMTRAEAVVTLSRVR